MVELKGSLSGIGLPAIIQLIDELHHSGTLQLSRADLRGTLLFDDGRLVDAECGDSRGLQAVASCVMEFASADFEFVDGPAPADRTLDLGPDDLRKLIARVASGDFNTHENGTGPNEPTQIAIETACPLLGFADDRSRHYSRATALHRCFASGVASLVTPQEQRDLCLSGRFATCPRFRNRPYLEPVQVEEPTLIVPTPPLVAPQPLEPRPVAPQAPAETEVPTWIGHDPSPAAAAGLSEPTQPIPPPPARPAQAQLLLEDESPRRGIVFIGGGIAAGLVLIALILFVVVPLLTQPPRAPVTAPAFEPVATATRIAAAAARATAVDTLVNQPTAAPTAPPTRSAVATTPPRPPTPAVVPQPLAALGLSLMDVRFASGPAERWLDNPPYAAWSDGAYRFQARDAARFVAVGVPLDRALGDVVVSATFRKTGGPPGGGYGLIVRDQGPQPRDGVNQQANAYVLETGDLGEYGVWRRDGDRWIDLVPWTHSSDIRLGGSPNDLTVRAVGDHLIFTVNGSQLADIQDSSLVAGGLGVFVGGDDNEVALDHFTVGLPD